MIDKIKILKKYVNSIKAAGLNEYRLLQERCISYNGAIDDVEKLLSISTVITRKELLLAYSSSTENIHM